MRLREKKRLKGRRSDLELGRMGLKRRTANAHASLDRLVDSMGFFADVTRYNRFLNANAAAHAVVEKALEDGGYRDAFFLPSPRRSVLARQDATELAPSVPLATPLKPLSCIEEALGVLYVVEGSSLGGRVLAKRLSSVPIGSGGVHFLSGDVIDAMDRWRACVRQLDEVLTTETAVSRAAESANRVFDLFTSAFRTA